MRNWHDLYFRIIDIFYPKREFTRIIYFIQEYIENDRVVEIRLIDTAHTINSPIRKPIPFISKRKLENTAQRHILSKKEGALRLDDRMKWQVWLPEYSLNSFLQTFDLALFPLHYYWDITFNKWFGSEMYVVDWNYFFQHRQEYTELLQSKRQNMREGIYRLKKKGECVFCHEFTDDYWYYDGKTGTCKCNKCYKEGIA